MSREEYLKSLIELNYKSLRSFAADVGIAPATLTSILKKGMGGTSVDTMLLICDKLNVDINEFRNTDVDVNNAFKVSISDYEIIKKYHKLNESDKSTVDFIFSKAEYNTAPNDTETAKELVDRERSNVKSITRNINKT